MILHAKRLLLLATALAVCALATGGCAYSTSRGRVDESIQRVYVEYLTDRGRNHSGSIHVF